ncbi:hypothetical protein BDZ89DRAFT_174233 [Hymenopellis radicata]|nr:hypothetical protein BDZ89DRAFT_174233 [Hymenopellis radicata]
MDSVTRADVKQVAIDLPVLHSLLRSPAIVEVFRLPSLQSYLASFSEPRHDRSRLQDRLGYTIIDDERRECEGSGDHVLRYLMTLTSWYYAIITLADAYTPVKISLPVLRLVFCSLPRPSQPEYRHGKVLARGLWQTQNMSWITCRVARMNFSDSICQTFLIKCFHWIKRSC